MAGGDPGGDGRISYAHAAGILLLFFFTPLPYSLSFRFLFFSLVFFMG